MIYIPKHFIIQEYVPPHIFKKFGVTAWEFLDPRLLMTDDALRDRYGPMTINNWHMGGARHWSGLRTPLSPEYSETSQHSFGGASDNLFKNIEAEEVRQDVLKDPSKFPYISAIELGVAWFHKDVRNCNRIKTFTA